MDIVWWVLKNRFAHQLNLAQYPMPVSMWEMKCIKLYRSLCVQCFCWWWERDANNELDREIMWKCWFQCLIVMTTMLAYLVLCLRVLVGYIWMALCECECKCEWDWETKCVCSFGNSNPFNSKHLFQFDDDLISFFLFQQATQI